jgi:hypothetical protein
MGDARVYCGRSICEGVDVVIFSYLILLSLILLMVRVLVKGHG